MLPRLEAERELTTVNAVAAAFGNMRRTDRERYVGRLRRTAAGGGAPARATPAALAAMGIGVEVVPPKSGGDLSAPRSGQEADRLGGPNG